MSNNQFKSNWIDILIHIGVYAALAAFFCQLAPIPADVRGYPLFLLCGALVCNTILFIKALSAHTAAPADTELSGFMHTAAKVLLYIVVIAAYIALISKISYILSTLLFLLIMLLLIGIRKPLPLILLPTVTTLTLYCLFTFVLQVILPRGTWIRFYF